MTNGESVRAIEGGATTARASTPLPTSLAAQKLLDWLQNVWKEPTVRANDIRQFGPNCIRDRKIILDATEFLERYRWLVPMKTRQHNEKKWQIAIGALDLSEDSYRARYNVLPG